MFEITRPADTDVKGFYSKQITVFGIKILGSSKVDDLAMLAAAETVANMVNNNSGMIASLNGAGATIGVIDSTEKVTQLPEYANLNTQFPGTDWSQYRGLGGTSFIPMSSAGEENLLQFTFGTLSGDPYGGTESILSHEFSHAIMNLWALPQSSFNSAIAAAYANAKQSGLWVGTYAITNSEEYFAELSQVWLESNPPGAVPGTHNSINLRSELLAYDPRGYELMRSIYRSDDWTPGDYIGTRGDDRISGSSLNDMMIGLAGNDVFAPQSGTDLIDGGDGKDTIILSGNSSSYTISIKSLSSTITAPQTSVTFDNIERVQFDNGTLALDVNGTAGQAYRVYEAAFNRTPDQGGLSFWIKSMDAGTSLIRVSQGFIDSGEFKTVYGTSPSNQAFVQKLYQNVLNRDGEQAGVSYWLGQLESGISKAQVLASFAESAENVSGTAQAIKDGIWF
ncbi:DUF4214 domain-containing protein [Rhizobium lemnae]|uniref:DUF4214 domain-containing protein n=1 Tax=Rhizobium lemnae TaxID=1214924 RepID=A0ABV8EA72_9HYPH|nr:DUF4214 domain-containing protein [Rhizobium lemnae]MCJ8508744.1 DUF4214 domain-containing protein [Rhizobium lemnae]